MCSINSFTLSKTVGGNPPGTNDPKLHVNPNPVDDAIDVTIFLEISQNVNLRIRNLTGTIDDVLFNGNLDDGESILQFDLSGYPSGAYYITKESFMATERFNILKN